MQTKDYYLKLYQYYSLKSEMVSHVGWKRRYNERAKQAYSKYLHYKDNYEWNNFDNLMRSIEIAKTYSTENFDLFGNIDDKSEHLRQSLLTEINRLFGSYQLFKLADWLYNIYRVDREQAYEIFLYKGGGELVENAKEKINVLNKYIEIARKSPGEKVKDFYSLKKIKKYLA